MTTAIHSLHGYPQISTVHHGNCEHCLTTPPQLFLWGVGSVWWNIGAALIDAATVNIIHSRSQHA